MNRTITPLLAAIVALAGIGLGGCGQSEDEQLADVALRTWYPQRGMLDSPEGQRPEVRRNLHDSVARGLDRALENYPGADERLRRLISDIRDGERELADGTITGAEADELRERHAELWSHLERGELPPEYR